MPIGSQLLSVIFCHFVLLVWCTVCYEFYTGKVFSFWPVTQVVIWWQPKLWSSDKSQNISLTLHQTRVKWVSAFMEIHASGTNLDWYTVAYDKKEACIVCLSTWIGEQVNSTSRKAGSERSACHPWEGWLLELPYNELAHLLQGFWQADLTATEVNILKAL